MIEQAAMDISRPCTMRRASAAWLAASLALGCCLPVAVLNAQAPAPTEAAAAEAATAAVPPPAEAAKTVAPPSAEPANAVAPPLELSSLAWLDGCWRGEVAQYEFREHWLPLRGGMMVGAGHVVFQGKTQDYGYLRLETRPDGVYYVSISSSKMEIAFRLAETAIDDKDTIFTFTHPGDEFPQRVVYRRGIEGWLYASVEGKVKGVEKKVIYPMRRVDCQSGDLIRK
jgi:hypothetical protein